MGSFFGSTEKFLYICAEYTDTSMNVLELSEQEIYRREALQQLRDKGIDPYPAAEYPVDAYSTEIKENFDDNAAPARCVWPAAS